MKESVFRRIIVNISLVVTLTLVCIATIFAPGVKDASTNNVSAIYRGNQTKNNISLMINVYWGTEHLDSMLETLKKKNVKATFFVGGVWVKQFPDVLKKINSAGHEIGNHGYNHKDSSKISKEKLETEIISCETLVENAIGKKMNLFAPPSGDVNSTVVGVASRLGYKTIMWSQDTIDWRDKDSGTVLQRMTNKPQNGGLILMHPTSHTDIALPKAIDKLKSLGYNLTTVSATIE